MTQVRLTVNGKPVADDVPARLSLADFLRERRNLTGTHLGCEHGVCGACAVLVDREPARACLMLAVACEGRDVRTIEGLENDKVVAALRQAFKEHHGLQCGFCTPAMLITARDLISRKRAGSDGEIRKGLSGNICRCTGYTNIVTAGGHAAQAGASGGGGWGRRRRRRGSGAGLRCGAKQAPSLLHEQWPDNMFIERVIQGGDIDAAAREAEIVVRREYKMHRQVGVPLEGRGVLAYRDRRLDELVVYTSTQVPHTIRLGLSEKLGIEERRIRVVPPDVGGGFGTKARLSQEEVTVAALALHVDHPVRWIEDRSEHLLTAIHCREHLYRMTAYADRRGRILGLDAELIVDAGAYALWPHGPFLETGMAARNLPGPYAIRHHRVKTFTVATNKSPIGPYRGVGRPGACFAIERTLDEVARAVGRDPLEVRIENMVRPEQMPYTSVAGMIFDGGDYPQGAKLCAETLNLTTIRARQKRGEPDGRLIGVGFAAYSQQTPPACAALVTPRPPFLPTSATSPPRLIT